MSEHPEIAEHEWFETPYGTFRVEQKRFGTWTSYSKEGKVRHHRTHEGAVMAMSPFHLEGVATNWANCRTSDPYDGTVGGKL